MRVDTILAREGLPCTESCHDGHLLPGADVDPERVHTVLIAETPPANPRDDYYGPGKPLFARTTVQAFKDAGHEVSSVKEILDLGVYLTTAVKCIKLHHGVRPATIRSCSNLLERELALFPAAQAYLLMGEVAIRAVNEIARRRDGLPAVPAESIYKIRGGDYRLGDVRLFPSYLQAGPSFFIEKSKRAMIAADIAAALRLPAAHTG